MCLVSRERRRIRYGFLGEAESEDPEVNLLLISEGDGDANNHYCWIKDLSRLLSSQVNNRNGKVFFCKMCLNSFKSEGSLKKHLEYCSDREAVKTVYPKEGTILKFKNLNNSMRVPFVVYADFECFTKEIPSSGSEFSKTIRYQKHSPSGFCFLIVSANDVFKPIKVSYTTQSSDDDVSQVFVNSLEKEVRNVYENHKPTKPSRMTKSELENYDDSVDCHICGDRLGGDKVLDHCHLTGNYRGAAHNKCNLNYKIPKFYPVILHNLAGYDAHLFIRNLGVTEGEIKCIPNNEEKYISFTKEIVVGSFVNKNGNKVAIKRGIRFIDSLKFMSFGLGKLVSNLDPKDFKNMRRFYDGHRLELLLRKGVYPYDYMNGLDKLEKASLPEKKEFYSRLNDEDITDEEYEHAKEVWETFDMKTMRDYHDLYMTSDVILLADVFENFRDICMENYDLDPCWYYTSPGLAWDACLKMTKIELELLSDADMVLMVEKRYPRRNFDDLN